MFQYLVLTTQHIFCQPVINTSHLTLYRKIFAACSETIQNRQQHCLNRNNLQKTHQQNEDKCKIGRWACPFRIGDLVLLEDHSLCQVVTRCRRNYCRGCVVSFQLNTFYTGIGYFGASHKSFSFFFFAPRPIFANWRWPTHNNTCKGVYVLLFLYSELRKIYLNTYKCIVDIWFFSVLCTYLILRNFT